MLKLITKIETARHFARNENGATAIEYGLIAALLSVVIIGAVTLVGGNLTGTFNAIAGSLTNPPAAGS